MDLQGIISVSGKPGLYKIVSRSRGGIIVESLIDGKKMPVHSANKVSALEDISMYTYEEDVPLKVILQKIFAHTDGKEALDPKSDNAELFDFFRAVEPEFDEERVYASDLKKLFAWYNLLLSKGLVDGATEEASAIEDVEAEEVKDAE
tara:strand:- start:11259 stop:11702 length:444 start_codon:yes stop_codon:yes gene_type:complete